MIWNILIIKRNDTKTVTIWWLGRSLFQEEGIQNVLIWWLGRDLLSREETLNTSSFDDLEKLIFNHKILNSFCDDDLEEEYFQEKRYRDRYDPTTWKKLVSRRKETKSFMNWWLGGRLFSREEIRQLLWFDDLEMLIFKGKHTENIIHLMTRTRLFFMNKFIKNLKIQ